MMNSEKTKPQAGGPGASESVTTLADGQKQNTLNTPETEAGRQEPDPRPEIRIDQARAFLALIDPQRESWHFRTVFEHGKRGTARQYHGRFDDLAEQLVADNLAGSAVYAVMNPGGRTDAEITGVCALFADFDGTPLPATFDHEPHLISETSPGKYHAYWLVEGMAVAQFKPSQQALARRYLSDASVCNPSRLVRLPGFMHNKGAPHLSRIIHTSGAQPFPAALFVPPPKPETTNAALHEPIAILRDALGCIPADDYEEWVAIGHCLSGLGETGRDLWLEWSKQSAKYQESDSDKWDTFKGDRAGLGGIYARARKHGWTSPPDVAFDDDREASLVPAGSLPSWADELLELPYGLGSVQRWVLGRMKYPSPATAGVTAFALLNAFAMGHITVESYGGLGLNEQFLVLAPTGFGKEDLRDPFGYINDYLRGPMMFRPSGDSHLPRMTYSAPASQQGLHRLLENHRIQCFLADEFAEWLGHAATDSHKQQALGHIMQAYTKALSVLEAPFAVTNQYEPVKHPRILIMAMSTAERMLEAMSASQADSGALNRFVIHVAEQERIPKKYEGLRYVPDESVLDLFAWLQMQPETKMAISREAWEFFMEHDSGVIEPLRFTNNVLAARLSEQAIKMAAVVALSDRRLSLERRDLELAYKVRESMYHRAAAMIGGNGAISGLHDTGVAIEQLSAVFRKNARVYRSALGSRSRKYKGLSVQDQAAVVRGLLANGIARYGVAGEHVLESLVYRKP